MDTVEVILTILLQTGSKDMAEVASTMLQTCKDNLVEVVMVLLQTCKAIPWVRTRAVAVLRTGMDGLGVDEKMKL